MKGSTSMLLRLCKLYGLDAFEVCSRINNKRNSVWYICSVDRIVGRVSAKDIKSLSEEELIDVVVSTSMRSMWS